MKLNQPDLKTHFWATGVPYQDSTIVAAPIAKKKKNKNNTIRGMESILLIVFFISGFVVSCGKNWEQS